MTMGMNIMDGVGKLVFSSDDITWNQVDFFLVGAGESVSKTYPIISGREVLVTKVLIDPPPLNRRAVAPTTSVSGVTVNVYGGTERAFIGVLMR